MQALDPNIHKMHLSNILVDIYRDTELSKVLGFKGGTAAMLFYSLPRLSVDLDFDLIPKYKPESIQINSFIEKITDLVEKKYTINDQSTKYNTLFWALSYGEGTRQIKVEVSTREQPLNKYDLVPLYGVTIKLSQIRDMIAHKLTAIPDRKSLANRDIFDTHYFLSSKYSTDINYEILTHRTGKSPENFFLDLIEFLRDLDGNNLLDGLGELLIDDKQKLFVKTQLLDELIGSLEMQIDMKLWNK